MKTIKIVKKMVIENAKIIKQKIKHVKLLQATHKYVKCN